MKKFLLCAATIAATMAGANEALAQDEGQGCDASLQTCQGDLQDAQEDLQECQSDLGECRGERDWCAEVLANACKPRAGQDGDCQKICERTHGRWVDGACECNSGFHHPRRNPCLCVTNERRPRGGPDDPRPPPPPPPPHGVFCPEGTARVGQSHPGDADCDGVLDAVDNCSLYHNPPDIDTNGDGVLEQRDYDHDGLGATCDDRDDLALHGSDLAPLAARIQAIEERLRGVTVTPPPPGEALPEGLRERWEELLGLIERFNQLATTVGSHTQQIARLDRDLRGLDGRVGRLERRVSDIERLLGELQQGQAKIFQFFWLDGAYVAFPGQGATVSGLLGEFGLRIAQFGPFAVSGSVGFGSSEGQFAYYVGGLGEFLLNHPSRATHFSLGVGFAAFANERAPFEDDIFGWRGLYLEPTAFIRLGDEARSLRFRAAVRVGLGQSFFGSQAATGWMDSGMAGLSLGISIPGLL